MDQMEVGQWAVLGAALAAPFLTSRWYRHKSGIDSASIVLKVVAGGLAAGRLLFVVRHTDDYFSAPLTIFDISDGGFSLAAAALATVILGVELTKHGAAARRPLIVGTLVGVAIWIGGSVAILNMAPGRAQAPSVALRSLDGAKVRVSEFVGKPLVINLWASWCPPCRREMPALQAAQRSNPDVTFIFVNQEEDQETILRYLAGERLLLSNVVMDAKGEFGRRAGMSAMPTTLFYGADGRLVSRHTGELNDDMLRKRLAALKRPPAAQ